MKNKEGFVVPLLLGVIALLVVGGGIYVYQNKKVEAPNVVDTHTQQSGQVQKQTNTQNIPQKNTSTYTYRNHGFSIELPKGFIPREEQAEVGPYIIIELPDNFFLTYVTDYSFYEKYELPYYAYQRDEKIGETIFKFYRIPNDDAGFYLFRRGNVAYQFNLNDIMGYQLKELLKTFKYIGWPQTATPALTQSEAYILATTAWGDCAKIGECQKTTVTISKQGEVWYVTALYEGLHDDSVGAEKKIAPAYYNNGVWSLGNATVTQRCQLGRGHQDFSSVLCL